MNSIIDFHTHAFPDPVAQKAIPSLEKAGDIKAYLDGTVNGLLSSMKESGIAKSVICSIATKPEQFQPILDWSLAIRSSQIIPLPSIHPADPHLQSRLETIHTHGFKGIKLHPYYQDFFLDAPSLNDLYSIASDLGLVIVAHTGYDIAYPKIRRADPQRILNVVTKFPELRFVATHLGGWNEWDDVRKLLTGKPIYMELSFALDFLDEIRIRDLILSHPQEYILFGSDSPWADQMTTLTMLKKLGLPAEYFTAITETNATKLLNLQ